MRSQDSSVSIVTRVHAERPRNLSSIYGIEHDFSLLQSIENGSGDHTTSYSMGKKVIKGKAVPLEAWSGPEGSRKLRFPDFMRTAQDGGKVSLTHRPPLPPGNTPGTYFW